ncbi:HlyIII-domain-containing protein [Ascobolus immersus RN42]|uniref:HlyIII-domain-containing protein n=1 Tax=Ascobolus immersus RN42 TaxID=1160509 RepID=A0A3N4HJ32_ASCIM|nr:HlyIII-domain-containing protein [Ascobolus immersus RN42]
MTQQGETEALRKRVRRASNTTYDTIVDAAHSAEHAVESTAHKVYDTLTIAWDQLPSWQQDNHFILTGYRPPSLSFRRSFSSLLHLHNETINIYTHLLGSLIALLLTYTLYTSLHPRYDLATPADKTVFTFFFAGCFVCLGLSAFYHTVCNHSPEVCKFGNKLDYIGIVFMIAGSYVPSVFYGFKCHPHLRLVYWGITFLGGLACCIATFDPHFRTPRMRPWRAAMYVLYGANGLIAVSHGVVLMGWREIEDRIQVVWMLGQGGLYVLGAVIYACRVPERWAPGRFDIVGSSHQVFHCLVLAAAATHLGGVLRAFDYAHGEGAVCRV